MKMTYRARRRLRSCLVGLGVVALLAVLAWGCWMLWLQRFVVYTPDGAVLNFQQDYRIDGGEPAVEPVQSTVPIHYNEGEDRVNNSTELTQITGYYATTSMLLDSVTDVRTSITALPKGTAVMLDLKSGFGNFYYSTDVVGASVTDQIDTAMMDELIKTLAKSDYYLIARVPAFRDRAFGLENTEYGLPTEGGYLWYDDDNCYWLDPTSSGTMFYLTSIATELRELGFDEVVFTEFRVPDTSEIVWRSDLSREDALAKAAKELVDSCATNSFAVSFETGNSGFALPSGRSRLYLTGVEASQAQSVLDAAQVPDKQTQLVFLTEAMDTRYDITSVLRPLQVVSTGE